MRPACGREVDRGSNLISSSENTIAKEGIELIVTGPRGQSHKWERALHLMWLSNDEETLILRGIEYESETVDEGSGASLTLPLDLRRMLEVSDAANSIWLTKKKASLSRISFTTKPDPNLSIEIFKDQKLRGTVSTIDVSIHLAEETIAVATAFRECNEHCEETDKASLGVTICLPKDEFDELFRDHYIAGEKPHLSILLGLLCYQVGVERAFAEPWHHQTIMIEEGEQQSVDLESITSGRIFKSVAPKAKEAESDTVVANERQAGTEGRFDQAVVRPEARQIKLASSIQRFLLAFVLITGLLLLARGHFL
jgi:hypothetical protein